MPRVQAHSQVSPDDALIQELRGYAQLTGGQGMHISVSGAHLRAVLARIDALEPLAASNAPRTNGHRPPPPWQEALVPPVQVLAEILESDDYADLCGVNALDALAAWATRNPGSLNPSAMTAV